MRKIRRLQARRLGLLARARIWMTRPVAKHVILALAAIGIIAMIFFAGIAAGRTLNTQRDLVRAGQGAER